MKRLKKHLKIIKKALINRLSLIIIIYFNKSFNNFYKFNIFIILFYIHLFLLINFIKFLRAIY